MKEELTPLPLVEVPLGLATLRADITTLELATNFAGFSKETIAICEGSALVKNLKNMVKTEN